MYISDITNFIDLNSVEYLYVSELIFENCYFLNIKNIINIIDIQELFLKKVTFNHSTF